MPALLDDIIDTATDGKQPMSNILRKCLRLGHELRNDRLKAWANQELSGYDGIANLPEYRICPAGAFGNFSGPFHSSAQNYPIPSVALDEKHRVFAETVYLRQAVSAYEDAAVKGGATNLAFPWPANLALYYQTRFFEGRFALISAWQELPMNAIVELLDTIRNRTLRMALEIKDELGSSYGDLRQIEPSVAEHIRTIVVNVTGGGSANLAFGHASIASTHETVIEVGDRRTLDSILKGAGLDTGDIEELPEALPTTGEKKLGTKIQDWIRAKAPKIVVGGAKIGMQIGTELLTKWLLQYYGLA